MPEDSRTGIKFCSNPKFMNELRHIHPILKYLMFDFFCIILTIRLIKKIKSIYYFN
jgi:hypothetical protein